MRFLRLISQNLSNTHQILCQNPTFNRSSRFDSSSFTRQLASASLGSNPLAPSHRVSVIADEISHLTLRETCQLTDVLRQQFWIKDVPIMVVMMPGMGFSGVKVVEPRGMEEKVEKTGVDVKLDHYNAAPEMKMLAKGVMGEDKLMK